MTPTEIEMLKLHDKFLAFIKRGRIKWEMLPIKDHPEAMGYTGTYGRSPLWRFVVASFDIENQGFPPGSKGYDGTATDLSSGRVIHLPRETATALGQDAEKAFIQ
jgi:hypothetical protein